MSITEAIQDLVELLAAGRTADEAVSEIAQDYALNPALLHRKFAERHGTSPNAYTPPLPRKILDQQLASTKARKWGEDGVWGEHVVPAGTIFEACGKQWSFVGLRREVFGSAVIAIEVGRVRNPSISDLLGRGCVPCMETLDFEAAKQAIIDGTVD